MELKITADKKLLEALEKIAAGMAALTAASVHAAAAIETTQEPAAATVAAPTAEPKEEPTPKASPAAEPPVAPESKVPSRDEIQRLAIVKIQAGLGSSVKKLVEKYGAARVGEVPEDKLAEFKADLEVLA